MQAGLKLHQSYLRMGPKRLLKVNRYAHARQMKLIQREVKKSRTFLGRVVRDVERKTGKIANSCVQQLAEPVLDQERTGKNEVYSVHAPDVDCISKGTAHKRYEFGVKAKGCVPQSNQLRIGRSGDSGQSVRWSYAGRPAQLDN